MTIQKTYHHILMIGSVIGLIASFFLLQSTISLLKNPDAILPCNLSPFVSCTNAALSPQANAFGFSNAIIGLVSFSMLFAIGVMLFSGGRAKKPLWLFLNLLTLGSTVFVVWFIYQSLYNLGTLCVYCMIVWAVNWPLFLYTTLWNFKEDHFIYKGKPILNSFFSFIYRNHWIILALWYFVIILLILIRFKDYFFASL